VSISRILPAAPAPAHPELAALLLAFADVPLGEGDAALGTPRLVLADWLAEHEDEREVLMREGVRAEDRVLEPMPDDDGVFWPDMRASCRRWRRRLLALFPEVLLSWPDPARPGGLVLCPARLLVPEEPPA
jgi:uncharacterized protein (TIGR02996 family)